MAGANETSRYERLRKMKEQGMADKHHTETQGLSEYEEMSSVEQAALHYEKFMEALGVDTNTPHTKDTPERVAKAYYNELYSGLRKDPRRHLQTTFPLEDSDQDGGFVIVDNIQVSSQCAHHALPFTGRAHVGYIPYDEVVGLSKLARVTDEYARRPQVQERLTNQIADAVHEELDPLAVVVVLECEHECMSLRGIQEPHSTTRTSALRGEARNDHHIKDEFLSLVKNGH